MRHTLPLTVLLAAGSAIALSSCGNYLNAKRSGSTGVSHVGNGNLSLHVNTWDNSTKRVNIVAGREDLASDEKPSHRVLHPRRTRQWIVRDSRPGSFPLVGRSRA